MSEQDGVRQTQGTDEVVGDGTEKPDEQGNRHGTHPDVDSTDTSSDDEQVDIGGTDAEGDTFPRSYVEELRGENATYRNRAKDAEAKADELAQALWTERVRSLGVLADPADLPYDPEALDDLEQIRSKADELLSSKPHLRTRKITERAGQGERGAETVSLVELLQRGA